LTIYTIGHSTRTFDDFVAALAVAGVDCIADVRRYPHSRRHPQFNIEALGGALPAASIAYRHFEALGGRRPGAKADASPSANTLWREVSFRNYADYALTGEFRAAFAALLVLAEERTVGIMCAEAVWWRCHRRIITDYLLAAQRDVRHILDKGKIEPARLTEGAVAQADGTVLYPAPQGQLL
jgi:uncharacterized protein (DUF488 family)